MGTINWNTDRIANTTPEEFYNLIARNRQHIYLTFPATYSSCTSLEKTKTFLKNAVALEQEGKGYYFYLRNSDNLMIGYICIKNIDRNCDKCELAYFIDKEYQGQGIISKAVSNITAYCFNEINMNKVFICTATTNIGSQRVAKKNGYLQEGLFREDFKNGDGQLEDTLYFGLLKSEYNER